MDRTTLWFGTANHHEPLWSNEVALRNRDRALNDGDQGS